MHPFFIVWLSCAVFNCAFLLYLDFTSRYSSGPKGYVSLGLIGPIGTVWIVITGFMTLFEPGDRPAVLGPKIPDEIVKQLAEQDKALGIEPPKPKKRKKKQKKVRRGPHRFIDI